MSTRTMPLRVLSIIVAYDISSIGLLSFLFKVIMSGEMAAKAWQ
ncbi:MAG: hypothetical protein Q9M17_10360 [Mariprofundus sp.]|nr:hypothetical protein [Mariprofundus sp.]